VWGFRSNKFLGPPLSFGRRDPPVTPSWGGGMGSFSSTRLFMGYGSLLHPGVKFVGAVFLGEKNYFGAHFGGENL